jgi:repressor LexA
MTRYYTKAGDPPTERQAEVMWIIKEFIASKGFPPTVRDIAAELGIASPNGVQCHLKALTKKGLLVHATKGSSRNWVPVETEDDIRCPTCGHVLAKHVAEELGITNGPPQTVKQG